MRLNGSGASSVQTPARAVASTQWRGNDDGALPTVVRRQDVATLSFHEDHKSYQVF
jgi:hypothetical protein